MDFKPGDLVRLKSGGPRMTVERVGKDITGDGDEVSCVWTELVGKKTSVNRDAFPPVVLKSADDSPPGVVAIGSSFRR